MAQLSAQQESRSRKNLSVMLKALCTAGQGAAASAIGVHESTVSRMKGGEISQMWQMCKLLAAIGLKVVPVDSQCFSAEHVEALRVLALQSSLLTNRADQLEWD